MAFILLGTLSQATAQGNGAKTVITFDPAGAIGTYPKVVNNARAVTGSYLDSAAVLRGFLRADDGTITTFDPVKNV